jgi:hypothetical protein
MFMIKKDYNLLSGDEKMYHLQYKVNNELIRLSCVRSFHTKGRSVPLIKFVEIPKDNRCKKCQKMAEKLTSLA